MCRTMQYCSKSSRNIGRRFWRSSAGPSSVDASCRLYEHVLNRCLGIFAVATIVAVQQTGNVPRSEARTPRTLVWIPDILV